MLWRPGRGFGRDAYASAASGSCPHAGSARREHAEKRGGEPRGSIVRSTNNQVLVALKPVPDHLVFIERLPIEFAVDFEPRFSEPVEIITPIETYMIELAE